MGVVWCCCALQTDKKYHSKAAAEYKRHLQKLVVEGSGTAPEPTAPEPKAEISRWDSKTGLNDLLSDLESGGSGNNSTASSSAPSRSTSSTDMTRSASVTPPPPTKPPAGHMQSPPRPTAPAAPAASKDAGIAASKPAAAPAPVTVFAAPASGMGLVVPGALAVPGAGAKAATAPAPALRVSSLGKSGIKRSTLGAKKISSAPATTPALSVATATTTTALNPNLAPAASTDASDSLENAFAKLSSSAAPAAASGATTTPKASSSDDDDFMSFDELDKQKEKAAADVARVKAHAAKNVGRKGPAPAPETPLVSGINAAYMESMQGDSSGKSVSVASPVKTESIYRPAVPASHNNNARAFSSAATAGGSAGSNTLAQDRFKNQKGIGSDSFNDGGDSEAARAARAQLSGQFKNSKGIGSDMFTGNDDGEEDPYGTNGMSEVNFFSNNFSTGNETAYGGNNRTNNWR